MSSSPLCASARTASRTVLRATPSCSTSSGSVGMREPTGHSPEAIWARRAAMTCSDSADRRGWLRGMLHLRTAEAAYGAGDANASANDMDNMDSQSSHDSMMGRMTRMTGDETRTTASAAARTPATTARPERPGASTRAWRTRLLVVGIVLAALNLRPAITSFGALLEEVRDGLGMSGSVAGLLTSLPALCFAVLGVTAPRLARRFGPGAVVCAGMAAIATGLLVRPFVGSTAAFLLASGLALGGIAVSNVLMPVIVKRWFPDRVGSMTGLYSMALALGTLSAAAVTVPVTDALGGDWQAGLAVWAALAAAAVLPWLAFVRDRGASAPGRARRRRGRAAGGRRSGPPGRRRCCASPAVARRGRWPCSSVSRPPPPTSAWAGWRRSSVTRASPRAGPDCCSPSPW